MIERMWIDQPSTLQPLHHLHGTLVLAAPDTFQTHRVYFLSGNIISQQLPNTALSKGWPRHLCTVREVAPAEAGDTLHPDAQPFEQYPELALHIERMAMSGVVGSMISWDAFLRELNAALRAQPPAREKAPASALDNLVDRFAAALKEKLHASEAKYGHNDAWMRDDWLDDLIEQLGEHVQKGDPRDVAAYCAFAWHHGWSLTPRHEAPASDGEREPLCMAYKTGYAEGVEDSNGMFDRESCEEGWGQYAEKLSAQPAPEAEKPPLSAGTHWWHPDNDENGFTCWGDAFEDATDGGWDGPVRLERARRLPDVWAVRIDMDTDGDGEADDYEVRLFATEAEALAALQGAK